MAVRIVALRHAKPSSEGYAEDSLRPLSDEGRETQKMLMQMLEEKQINPTIILSSPLLRAKQTAQIATDTFGVKFQDEPSLGDEFDSDALLDKLSILSQNETIFLVGHAPSLGGFINRLVGENVIPHGLSKSSAAIVDFDQKVIFGKGKFIDYFKA